MRRYLVAVSGVLAIGMCLVAYEASLAQERKSPEDTPAISYRINQVGEVGMVAHAKGRSVQLTYSPDGGTNSTVLRIDGSDVAYGVDDAGWLARPKALGKGKDGRIRNGHWSTWAHERIKVTQVVEIVTSRTGYPDACLVFYQLENTDTRAHDVGLRAMVDTQIANNDGNPFAVGGRQVTNFVDFKTAREVSTAIEARETTDGKRPGFIAQFTLRVGGPIESPGRVSLTHWPGPIRSWDVPLENIAEDSCVALYWHPARLEPNARRLVGYAYGQGIVNLGQASK
jgi:hypothetical protein